MSKTAHSNSTGAQPSDLSNVSVRKSTFDKVAGMFVGDEVLDSEFVINAIEDLGVRDAILHSLSDVFLIKAFGDECTFEDMSEMRQMFSNFLFQVCIETRFTGVAFSIVVGLAILDGQTEIGLEIANEAVEDGYKSTLLDMFVKFGAHTPAEVLRRNFVDSVEENTIENCFI